MSIPVNERKAHAEMLRRFEARRRGVEVSWPPQQQHQQQRSLETSIINFPQGDKPQRDETRSLVGKGKGKVDFPLIEDGDSGESPSSPLFLGTGLLV